MGIIRRAERGMGKSMGSGCHCVVHLWVLKEPIDSSRGRCVCWGEGGGHP